MHCLKLELVPYSLQLGLMHTHFPVTYGMAAKLNRLLEGGTFRRLGIVCAILSGSLHHELNVLEVLLIVLGIDQYLVQVHNHKIIQEGPKPK